TGGRNTGSSSRATRSLPTTAAWKSSKPDSRWTYPAAKATGSKTSAPASWSLLKYRPANISERTTSRALRTITGDVEGAIHPVAVLGIRILMREYNAGDAHDYSARDHKKIRGYYRGK